MEHALISAFPPPGMYGHSAVYDASTHSVYLFGGVVYSRPVADLSNSLYVINVATRNWAKVILSTEVRVLCVCVYVCVCVCVCVRVCLSV